MKTFHQWEYENYYGVNGVPYYIPTLHRNLKERWSMEAAQDVKAMHNIDAEAELSAIMAKEIISEIDYKIIKEFRQNSER
jgi:hypothetical protein